MEYTEIKQRIMTVCVLGAIFTLFVALSTVFIETNPVADMLLNSPIFQVSLIIVLWFFSPIFVSATKINTNESIRMHTFLIIGLGLLLISAAMLTTWLMR